MPLWHEITDRWPAVLVLWHDQLLRLESTRERSLLRRSRKSRNWHPEILSKHAALQPTRFFASRELRNQPLIIFIEPSILTSRFSKYAIDHLNSNPIGFFKAGRVFLRHFPVGRRD